MAKYASELKGSSSIVTSSVETLMDQLEILSKNIQKQEVKRQGIQDIVDNFHESHVVTVYKTLDIAKRVNANGSTFGDEGSSASFFQSDKTHALIKVKSALKSLYAIDIKLVELQDEFNHKAAELDALLNGTHNGMTIYKS